jgi:DNA invertase Pin-like site-specific DNA recombinase
MKRFAEYLRFSSSPQDKLSSPEAHQRENRAYVERVGGVIVATYRDTISGRVRERAGLDQLLADCKRGLFDAVVIYDITRAGRKALVTHQIAEEIVSAGVELHSTLHGQYQFDDEMGEFRFGADVLFAQVDYRRTVRRLYDNRIQAAQVGRALPTGRLPYGLRRVYDPQTGKPRAEYDPQLKDVPRMIFEWADQGIGTVRICKRLHELGYPAPMQPYWQKDTVLKMLRNPAYTGEWRHVYKRKKGGPIEVTIRLPPLVDKDLFERVQARLANLKRGGRKVSWQTVFPLIGMIFCSQCGRRLKLGGNRHWPRSCPVFCPKPGCSGVGYHRYPTLEAACLGLADEAIKRKITALPVFPLQPLSPRPNPAKLKSLEARRAKIQQGWELGLYTAEEVKKRLEEIRAEMKALEAQMSRVETTKPVKLPKQPLPEQLREAGVCFVVYPDREIVMSVRSSLN